MTRRLGTTSCRATTTDITHLTASSWGLACRANCHPTGTWTATPNGLLKEVLLSQPSPCMASLMSLSSNHPKTSCSSSPGSWTCLSPTSSTLTYRYFIPNWLQFCFLVSRGTTSSSIPSHQGLLHYIWGD